MTNSRAFDCHVFIFSQDRWSMVFDVMRMISTQIRWQDPCWSLCKLWEHSLDFFKRMYGKQLPLPPRVKHTNTLINSLGTRSWDGFWHLIEDVLYKDVRKLFKFNMHKIKTPQYIHYFSYRTCVQTDQLASILISADFSEVFSTKWICSEPSLVRKQNQC